MTVNVPYGTDVSSMTAVFSHNGKTAKVNNIEQIPLKSIQNYTSVIVYSIFSEAGTRQDYTVSVNISPSNAKNIISFFADKFRGTILGTDIIILVSAGTDVQNLTVSFIYSGSSVKANGNLLRNAESSVNFSNPVIMTVTAADGSTQDYKVQVTVSDQQVKYTLGGSAFGLNGTVVLQNNGGESVSVQSSGSFTFSGLTSLGDNYNVTIQFKPSNQYCTVSSGTGTVSYHITDIILDCTSLPGTAAQSFSDLGNGTIQDINTQISNEIFI